MSRVSMTNANKGSITKKREKAYVLYIKYCTLLTAPARGLELPYLRWPDTSQPSGCPTRQWMPGSRPHL
jgi:hypothetical protein